VKSVPQISATAVKRRIPHPRFGVDVNFCRNAQCSQFGVQPDWRDGRGQNLSSNTDNLRRGEVKGTGDEKNFTCGSCGQASVIKNNRAVVEEYRRLRRLQWHDGGQKSCGQKACRSHGRSLDVRPELYRKSGRTSAGHQRYACKRCRSTFAVGHPARNHRRQSKNGQILKLLVHGTSLSKISEIGDLAPRDVYRKLDFIYECVREFTSRREGDLCDTDWESHGRRFATDSQTLTLNWPNRKKRASVNVQHLCTAHANSGYIVLGHLQFDPAGDMEQIEIDMALNGDLTKDRCWRQHGRLWTASEFKAYLDQLTAEVVIDPEIAPEVDLGLQLPHEGGLVRHDIQQYAHALILKRMVSKSDSRFYFVQDGDAGLSKAFLAAFAPGVRAGRVDVATVAFDKYQVNDVREALYAQGRKQLRTDLGLSAHQLNCLPAFVLDEELDRLIVKQLAGQTIGTPFAWPYHTKSEPSRVVDLKTDRADLTTERCARLMRLATLRSVDSYFHKIRSNVRPASRPVSTPSGNGRTWDRYFLYKPEMLVKIIEIYRFHHNWMGTRQTKRTPAMKLGLAKGRIYERDLFGD
jgi:transposase-like protein